MYKLGQTIEIDDMDKLTDMIDKGYEGEWVDIGVIRITKVPEKEEN